MDSDQADRIELERIADVARSSKAAPAQLLRAVLQIAAARLSPHLAGYLIHQAGACVVQGGPFAGMNYLPQTFGSLLPPKLLGTYEAELHGVISEIVRTPYPSIVNIGCGEGYYAVGLARLMPATRVVAFDSAPEAQKLCRQLAELNGVADRVAVRGACGVSELREVTQSRCLVLCDCEGGETALLDPEQIPGLRACDILVELHEFLNPAIPQQVTSRFATTHDLTLIDSATRSGIALPHLRGLHEMDRMLTTYEGRSGPTPWAFLKSRTADSLG